MESSLLTDYIDQSEVIAALGAWLISCSLPSDWGKRADKPWQIRRISGGYVGDVNEKHPFAEKLMESLPTI